MARTQRLFYTTSQHFWRQGEGIFLPEARDLLQLGLHCLLRHKPIEGSFLLCSFPTANASHSDSLAFISLGSLLERNNIFNS